MTQPDEQKPLNVAKPSAVRSAKRRLKLERETELSDLRWVLSDPRGRRVLSRILDRARLFGRCYVAEQPMSTAFNEGAREFGVALRDDIEAADQEALFQLMREKKG